MRAIRTIKRKVIEKKPKQVEMMNCEYCEKEIVRKAKNQKYCCVCNGIVNRENARSKRENVKQEKSNEAHETKVPR